MNSTLLALLSEPALRDEVTLRQYVAEHATSGTPWLIED